MSRVIPMYHAMYLPFRFGSQRIFYYFVVPASVSGELSVFASVRAARKRNRPRRYMLYSARSCRTRVPSKDTCTCTALPSSGSTGVLRLYYVHIVRSTTHPRHDPRRSLPFPRFPPQISSRHVGPDDNTFHNRLTNYGRTVVRLR